MPGRENLALAASPTKPTRPGRVALVEHEYIRSGALNLLAAFDTRTGRVYGLTRPRKRQSEFIEFLEQLEMAFEAKLTHIHLANYVIIRTQLRL